MDASVFRRRRARSGTVSGQLLDIDVFELNEAGRTAPDALLVLAAMMLEGESSACGKIGYRGPRDNGLSVQHNLDGFAPDGDLEMIPLADRLVRLGAWCGGGPKVGRCRRVGTDAVQFAGADRPAPDVNLELSIAAKEHAGIRIRKRHSHLLAMKVACMAAIRQDVGNILIEERSLFKPPIHLQDIIVVLP